MNNVAASIGSVAIGDGARATESGEWAFAIGKGNLLQVFPDGRILVRGVTPQNDGEALRQFVSWWWTERLGWTRLGDDSGS